ncbi:hypothetical protein FOL47_000959 [Perkinsus chesapeaki]|uniref:Uncharacterized protein n=1 Tax=Perkinsus chesapeaki TaxID=330153 RepID=A0A7J6MKH2_PERCH|nr:hypothetical protein FOL47_000959 [Perkinsus chesapeaki]
MIITVLACGFIQVQFANGEPERLGLPDDTEGYSQKLFVGNVPPSVSDDELKKIFEEHGTVSEAYSLESKRSGGNKAAFVRFSKKSDALKAIEAMNDKYTFPGEQHPIAVKCADTKEQRLAHKQEAEQHRYPGGGGDRSFNTPDQGSGYDRMGRMGGPRDGFQTRGGGYQPPPPPMAAAQPRRAGPWTEYLNHPDGRYYYHNSQTGQTQWEVPYEFQNMGPPPPPNPQPQAAAPGFQQTPQSNFGPGGGYGQMNMPSGGGSHQSGRSQHPRNGPPGANIFVYNLPNDWKDGDLAREFASCGTITTTKVIVDNSNGQSKGYGFVSYNEVPSAVTAVRTMDGFTTHTGKRLRVQIKKGEEEAAAQVMGVPVSQIGGHCKNLFLLVACYKMSRTYGGAPIDPQEEAVLVTGAGTVRTNGRYYKTDRASVEGVAMYRKPGSSLGLIYWEDGKWYIADCGDEFSPAGEDHLDFYSADAGVLKEKVPTNGWAVEEDGMAPPPKVDFGDDCAAKGAASMLMGKVKVDMRRAGNKGSDELVADCRSAIALNPTFDSYFTLATILEGLERKDEAYEALAELGGADWIKYGAPENYYVMEQRKQASELLARVHDPAKEDVAHLCRILLDTRIHRFTDYIVRVSKTLREMLDQEGGHGYYTSDGSTNEDDHEEEARAREFAKRQREFRDCDGLTVAHNMRMLYRNIEKFTFDTRDLALTRTKLFSAADAFRAFATPEVQRIDNRGVDATFKKFWQTDVKNDENPYESTESKLKDTDPEKEDKCPVIKNINESDDMDSERERQETYRKRLWDSGKPWEAMLLLLSSRDNIGQLSQVGEISLGTLHAHDCNAQLKLISVHGVVFDVSENLDKYAPDGEYFFFAGRDITWPLATSALNGEYADQFYNLSPEMRKKVYGWMEYYEKKYKVVGYLDKYHSEEAFPEPPPEDEQPEMECTIM